MTDKELYDLIAHNIKFYRKQAKLTQFQLAELCNISISYLSKIESSKCNKNISIHTLNQISIVLKIEIKHFFERKNNE